MKFLQLLLLLAVLLTAGSVHATNIAILRPLSPSPGLLEALFRLQGELFALGLQVNIVERPMEGVADVSSARASVERLAKEQSLDVVIDVIGERNPTAIDLWIFERSPQRSRVARVELEPDARNPAELLAIRAIEVLRSTFVEIDLAARGRLHADAPVPVDESVKPLPARVEQFGLEAGAAVMTSFGGIGPAFLPLLRLDWAANSRLVAQATVAALGTRPTLETAAGSARVGQTYVLFGACYCSPTARGVTLVFSLSAGALRTSLEGRARAPAEGHSVEQWSFLLESSAGGRLRLSDRYSLTLALHAQLAQPHVAVHFVDEVVATSGRPNLLLSLTAGAWL